MFVHIVVNLQLSTVECSFCIIIQWSAVFALLYSAVQLSWYTASSVLAVLFGAAANFVRVCLASFRDRQKYANSRRISAMCVVTLDRTLLQGVVTPDLHRPWGVKGDEWHVVRSEIWGKSIEYYRMCKKILNSLFQTYVLVVTPIQIIKLTGWFFDMEARQSEPCGPHE